MSRTLAYDDPEGQALQAPHGHSWYLCCFAHKYLNFRCAEVEALAGMVGCAEDRVTWRLPHTLSPPDDFVPEMNPFWRVALPGDDVCKFVASRSILTKAFMECWGEGGTWEELVESVNAYPAHLKEPWMAEDRTFKVQVMRHGLKIKVDEQKELFAKLTFLPLQGKVDLKQPEVVFRLQMVDVGEGEKGLGDNVQIPKRYYFGRVVAEYRSRDDVAQYTLSTRPYIGPTSMDTQMAFLMCNQAQVRAGQFACDPYMGTGSIGVAAAHYGAFIMGMDIDPRIIRVGKVDAQGQALDVRSNFDHYGIHGRLAGLMIADMSLPSWRDDMEEVFHCVVGDPPYGVRAGGRKVVARDVEIRDRATHIVGTVAYGVSECLRDLLDFAGRTLVVGGRLVYFLPAHVELYSEDEVPAHPMLKLRYNCEQLLNLRYSRRLVTMEKVLPYDREAVAAYHAANPDACSRLDQLHELFYQAGPGKGGPEQDAATAALYEEVLQARRFRGKRL